MQQTSINTNGFLKGYIDCALWSTMDSYDVEGNDIYSLDDEFDTVSDKCMEVMLMDCEEFISNNTEKLKEFKELAQCDDFRLGVLFWLNRSGHGSGYWDELPNNETVGDELSDTARAYGEFYLYGDFEDGCVKSHHYG